MTLTNAATEGINRLSISELISMHGRERLFVHPLLWTQRQALPFGLQLLRGGVLTPTVRAAPPARHSTRLNDKLLVGCRDLGTH